MDFFIEFSFVFLSKSLDILLVKDQRVFPKNICIFHANPLNLFCNLLNTFFS